MDTITRNGLNHSECGKLGYLKSKDKLTSALQKRINDFNLNPKKCKNCEINIPYTERRQAFCSRNCSATYHNKKRRKTKLCKGCSNKIEGYSDAAYCNRECWKKHHKEESELLYKNYIIRWKSGEEKGWYGKGYTITHYIRRYFFEKYDNKCQECGWSKINPSTGKVPLQIDHKDGDASNCKEENLRLYCPCCHSLTPTFGRLNKATVRKHR